MPEQVSPFSGPGGRSASDAALVMELSRGVPYAAEALQLLRARHTPALQHYARLCVADEQSADQLVRQAVSAAAGAAVAGRAHRRAVRHSLLVLVQSLAAEWAGDERHQRLNPAFARWLMEHGDSEPWHAVRHRLAQSKVLRAYWSLPQDAQELVWYAEVEVNSPEFASLCSGIGMENLGYEREHTLRALCRGYVQVHTEACPTAECRGYVKILDAQARSSKPGISPEFDDHRAACSPCDEALHELSNLYAAPRRVLLSALLGYGGTAYVERRFSRSEVTQRPGRESSGWWRPGIAMPFALAVLVAVLAAGAFESLRTSAEIPIRSDGRLPSTAAPDPTSSMRSRHEGHLPSPSRSLSVPAVDRHTARAHIPSSGAAGSGRPNASPSPATSSDRNNEGRRLTSTCVTKSTQNSSGDASVVVTRGGTSVSASSHQSFRGGGTSVVVHCSTEAQVKTRLH
ncbi:hypothetical protein [Streptomyces collinus]|uniref:hypothetical protein n=1 Tax=Streptomyces collinus TaxID=42684 RepID=UPI00331694F4